MSSDLDWSRAACAQPGVDPDLWFDAKDIQPPGTNHPPSLAAQICMRDCPQALVMACLRRAMDEEKDAPRDSRFGVFGGANPAQRYALWQRLHPDRAARARARAARIAEGRAIGREMRADREAA